MILRKRFVVLVVVVFCLLQWGVRAVVIHFSEERVMMVSRIYHVVSTFFRDCRREVRCGLREVSIHYFAHGGSTGVRFASMEFVADLHDGHTWFYDKWLDQNYGAPIGILAYPVAARTVVRSQLTDL